LTSIIGDEILNVETLFNGYTVDNYNIGLFITLPAVYNNWT